MTDSKTFWDAVAKGAQDTQENPPTSYEIAYRAWAISAFNALGTTLFTKYVN
jgi:hypothetical protein